MSSTAMAAAADAKTTMGAEGRVGAIARQVIVVVSEQGSHVQMTSTLKGEREGWTISNQKKHLVITRGV